MGPSLQSLTLVIRAVKESRSANKLYPTNDDIYSLYIYRGSCSFRLEIGHSLLFLMSQMPVQYHPMTQDRLKSISQWKWQQLQQEGMYRA